MAWVKLDDQFPDHPKVVQAGPLAAWLYVCGLAYCARYLTDGFIPAAQVRKLADVDDVTPLVTALVAVGLWRECEGGYEVHDYLDYNPPAAKVRAERAANAKRQAKFRDRMRNSEDEASPSDVTNDGSNGVSNGVSHGVSSAVPSPSPSPNKENEEEGQAEQPEERAMSPRERAITTLLEFGVSEKHATESLAVFPDSQMPQLALEALKFVAHWSNRPRSKRLKNPNLAWTNWLKMRLKFDERDKANEPPPRRQAPHYLNPLPTYTKEDFDERTGLVISRRGA